MSFSVYVGIDSCTTGLEITREREQSERWLTLESLCFAYKTSEQVEPTSQASKSRKSRTQKEERQKIATGVGDVPSVKKAALFVLFDLYHHELENTGTES
jgi:hypothetical protein